MNRNKLKCVFKKSFLTGFLNNLLKNMPFYLGFLGQVNGIFLTNVKILLSFTCIIIVYGTSWYT